MTALPRRFPSLPPLSTLRSSRPLALLAALALLFALLAAGYVRGGGAARFGASDARQSTIAVNEGATLDAAKTGGATVSRNSRSVAATSDLAGQTVSVAGGQRAAAPAAAGAPSAPQQTLPPFSPSIVDRMIVKTGALTLQLAETASGDALSAAMQRVNAVVAGIPGAYVAASSTSYRAEPPGPMPVDQRGIAPPTPLPFPRPEPQPSTMATLTLKVPVDSFDQAMQRLRELGSPLSESVSTQEVTEEYVDLEAQVRNLEATEQQYLRFLERAQRIEEILPIQQRLTEVRGQIERLRGRMTLLQRRSDVSTITISLVVPAGKGASGSAAEPRALRTLKEAWAHLTVALSGALDLVIYLAVYALPLVPIVAAIVWWRRRQPPAATAATAGGTI